MISSPDADETRDIALAELGDRLAALRLCDASASEAMRRSLARHGQLSPLVVFVDGGHLEVVDGFKRVQAARALGWATLQGCIADIGTVEAKVRLAALHDRRGLTELEEGWLIRSLYREDHLTQPAIAARLGRHKSWVFRRLRLVEALDPAVQADVRVGLLAARAAVLVAELPRGNQHDVAGLVIRRGLTVRQTALVVAELLESGDAASRERQIARWMDSVPPGARATPAPSRAARGEADGFAADIATVRRVAAQLHARLGQTPLTISGPEVALLLTDSLVALAPVLDALRCAITRVAPDKTLSHDRTLHDCDLAHT